MDEGYCVSTYEIISMNDYLKKGGHFLITVRLEYFNGVLFQGVMGDGKFCECIKDYFNGVFQGGWILFHYNEELFEGEMQIGSIEYYFNWGRILREYIYIRDYFNGWLFQGVHTYIIWL